MEYAPLSRYGLLSVTGAEARDFLHAQLTNDIANLPPERAALAGWCSAKGRLLASFVVIPALEGFLLQLARDLVPAVSKRLSMFVLRARVKIADAGGDWFQFGLWGDLPGVLVPNDVFGVSGDEKSKLIRMGDGRFLALSKDSSFLEGMAKPVPESRWALDEIRAGRPLITAATQDQFVPQMVNLEKLGGVDFQKGCYPGQEIVARAQYRGQVKRRMKLLRAPRGIELQPGQEFEGGTVVDAAPAEQGTELLAVMPIDAP
jgi:folate-binding protein YgfZ